MDRGRKRQNHPRLGSWLKEMLPLWRQYQFTRHTARWFLQGRLGLMLCVELQQTPPGWEQTTGHQTTSSRMFWICPSIKLATYNRHKSRIPPRQRRSSLLSSGTTKSKPLPPHQAQKLVVLSPAVLLYCQLKRMGGFSSWPVWAPFCLG